ncbi:MAG: transporter substrate-binding domain-containing protein [Clostridia bacterium]|nr:transporter substrate-binding domain-containing protein [Clostridia bacterium]
MKKKLFAVTGILAIIAIILFVGLSKKHSGEITSFDQLKKPGVKIGTQAGLPEYENLKRDYPLAEVIAYNDNPLAYKDVANGRLDAYIYARREMEFALANGTTGVRLLNENYSKKTVAVGISPNSPITGLQEKLNTFIAELRADGTLDDMYKRWVTQGDDTMPEIAVPDNPSYHLRIGTTGTVMPYSYYVGTELRGYDIELAYRFAAWLGADIKFQVYDFGGTIAAAAAGDIDCIMSNLYHTEENDDAIPFSDPLFDVEITAMVRDTGATAPAAAKPEYSEYSELSGKMVSMLTGAPLENLVLSKVPDVGEFSYYNNNPDMVMALKAGKTDAIMSNNAVGALIVNRNPELALFPQGLQKSAFGIAFAKGDPERDVWQKAYESISEETKQALWKKWTGSDDSVKTLPEQDWPGLNGTVQAAVCDTLEPLSYSGDGGQLLGFDIEMILLIAKELDVHVEFTGMELSAILSSVQSGKALIGAGSIIVTEERKQAVDFVEHYPAEFVLVVRAAQPTAGSTEVLGDMGRADKDDANPNSGNFFTSICDSFKKTFILEDRWKLFIEGIVTTMVITVLSIICGTILGFFVFMLCRRGNPVANTITRFCVWLVQGMPVVVLLMILYYIIFGKVSISGTVVSIFGFTLIFGTAVFNMLKSGVGAVDNGQTEAAYSLGYTDRRAFYRVVLPQALPHFMPAYKGQIIALIKSTAVVGYVAVQDLTKMGDIIRSRTYEAFFPLIAVAIVYFILAAILTFFVNKIEIRIDPRRRSPKDILKGVNVK